MTDLRASAVNLHGIAVTFENNAKYSTGAKAKAWNEACLRLLDISDALEVAADDEDGLWKLPLPAPVE